MAQVYGTGSNSSIGSQIRTDAWHKQALVETAKEMYFGQMADTRTMPKHMGKTIKQYHYLPILDDRNINDQGIDANGVSTATNGAIAKYVVKAVDSSLPAESAGGSANALYFEGMSANATYSTALANATLEAFGKAIAYFLLEGYNTASDTFLEFADAGWDGAGTGTAATGGPGAGTWLFTLADSGVLPDYGNLYGSSKDVGTITAKIPALTESGGRVNRVGMKRIQIQSTLNKRGFFEDYTKESVDFDTDDQLEMHKRSELVKAANELMEDELQIELLNAAGTIRYTGDATSVATLNGGITLAAGDTIAYDDLVKLAIELANNRTPTKTTIITGSRMIDTKVVNAAHYMFIGSELLPSLMRMTDYHGNKAFIPLAQYASAGTTARGEVGAIDNFRFIVVPEMMKWEASGATVADPDGGELFHFSATESGAYKYDVFPMLVVGAGSFTTIGFATDGKGVKFKIKHVKPESDISYSSENDPYGEKGFTSIKWYSGFMALRSERIALIKTVAEF